MSRFITHSAPSTFFQAQQNDAALDGALQQALTKFSGQWVTKMPSGMGLIMFSTVTPAGYLPCNGAVIDTATNQLYIDLVAVLRAFQSFSALAIQSIARPGGATSRYQLPGATDLSETAPGELAIFTGCTNPANDGSFLITAINDGADWIEVTNAAGVVQVGVAGTTDVWPYRTLTATQAQVPNIPLTGDHLRCFIKI